MKSWNKIIAITEIAAGAALLVSNGLLIRYFHKVHDTPIGYNGEAYSLSFLWLVLLLTGISFQIGTRLYWIFTQILLITTIVILFYPASSIGILNLNRFSDLVIIGFILLEIKLYKPALLDKFRVRNRDKLISVSSGLLCALIFWIIKIKFE